MATKVVPMPITGALLEIIADIATLHTFNKADKIQILKDTKHLLSSYCEIPNTERSDAHAVNRRNHEPREELGNGHFGGGTNYRFPGSPSCGSTNTSEKHLRSVVKLRNSVIEHIQKRVDSFTLKYEEPAPDGSNGYYEGITISIPLAPAPAPPLYHEFEAVSLVLGLLVWGEDVAGQVRALFDMMPHQYTGDRHIAARLSDQPNMALVQFPTAEDALTFQNGWNTDPPTRYRYVKALLSPDYDHELRLDYDQELGLDYDQ
ncbi:hypothetical protein B0H13DRAFT_2340050 [Mycena leptocephala]|nr:hypothetical protein B0H13DRAFT_2340050 [Mycena leptocephala]